MVVMAGSFDKISGSCAPLSSHFVNWEAAWGKILSIDTLMKKGWLMVNRCSLCKYREESTNHILIHLERTKGL